MQSLTLLGAADIGLRQYLSFRLGGLEYALDYRNVQEPVSYTHLTLPTILLV